jgi:geranylgeranyl diphosphate synthase type II
MLKTLDYSELLEKEIQQLDLPETPRNLYDPLRYFLTLGGKRTRPTLTLLACKLFGKDPLMAKNAALAIELFHNFTLIHDDIMDHAPLRRGKATVHEKWNTSIGILSGDVLFVEAYKLLAHHNSDLLPSLLEIFSKTAVEVCEGQQMDMDFEKRSDVSIDEYLQMIRLKTSVLLGAALKMGAVIAGANKKESEYIYSFGENIGLAFQLQDDFLDLFANPEKFGKQVGGDILSNKKTFLLLKAFEVADMAQKEKLNHLLYSSVENEQKVEAAQKLFKELNVHRAAKKLMHDYYEKAIESLNKISVHPESKKELIALADYLMNREH